MGVLVLTSATGAPGVTTTALGLALHWPRDVLLVDADATPSQAIEAGFLSHTSTQGHGLMALAQAHREGRRVDAAAWELGVPLTDDETKRRFITGFSHPAGAELFAPLWPVVAGALHELGSAGIDVIVDAGRIGRAMPSALLEVADAVVVVTRSSLRALAGLRLHLPGLLDAIDLAAPDARSGIVLIGAGEPYSANEVTGHFGVPVLTTLPRAEKNAAVLSDAAPAPRGHDRSAFNRSLHAAALKLSTMVGRPRNLVPSEPVRA